MLLRRAPESTGVDQAVSRVPALLVSTSAGFDRCSMVEDEVEGGAGMEGSSYVEKDLPPPASPRGRFDPCSPAGELR